MKKIFFLIFFSFSAFALTEKLLEVVPAPEVKIENTTEKSKLRPIELDKSVVLHHREPWLLPDGKVLEVIYFSHKSISVHAHRRSSVGLKISNDTTSETIILHQDLDRKERETLSTAESENYKFKLEKIVYDEEIMVTISQKSSL
jgi:hypothetical protein